MGGIWEIPMTLLPIPRFSVPFGGGVYFRLLPRFVIRELFRRWPVEAEAVNGYFHPYDIDTEQESFMHPGINGSQFYNALLRYNRGSVFPKLETVIEQGWKIMRFDEYLELNGSVGVKIDQSESDLSGL